MQLTTLAVCLTAHAAQKVSACRTIHGSCLVCGKQLFCHKFGPLTSFQAGLVRCLGAMPRMLHTGPTKQRACSDMALLLAAAICASAVNPCFLAASCMVQQQATGAHLWLGRWVPSNTWRHHCCHCVCIHLVHSCIATQPVESLQQQLQCAVIGCWQLGYDQVCQSWLLATMLN